MKELCILSKNSALAQYLKLELVGYVPIVYIWEGVGALPEAEAYIWDKESLPTCPALHQMVVCLAWQETAPLDYTGLWLDRPFRISRLRSMLGLEKTDGFELPTPLPQHRAALMGGKIIKLTDCEFRLYTMLYEAKGAFLSREALHQAIWNGEGAAGVVNVYMHYLRQNLEQDNQRIFVSARAKGYAVRIEE